VLEAAGERPVIFRTVDIGGDKSLAYLSSDSSKEDENPAMGWRALRLALEREGLLKVQARALMEAAAGRTLNVMFPMVSEPWEFDAAKAVFDTQLEFLKRTRRTLPEAIRYGVMLEVPSLAEMLDVLIPKVGFISIGTNDLTQFLFAADRANPKLAERYDWVSPAILRFLRRVVAATVGHPVQLGVCGEMGGRRLEALALLGLGITRLSITPAAVGPIKELVRKVDMKAIGKAMAGWLATPPPDMRAALQKWAEEREIEVE
jgi:phosphotransferase system enzyme I (PtsP)